MKTSHIEIMNTLVGLCKPLPSDVEGKVPFEPVREKMIEYYGAAVDHPDFCQAFRLVMDAGGHFSPHMADLHAFTKVHVNPKLRKMRFEAYAIVGPHPVQHPRIKNACLKWAWKQTPSRGWCQLPSSIPYRFRADFKYNLVSLFGEVEEAMCLLSECAFSVLGGKDLKKQTIWIGATDIGLMSKIFASPKQEDGLGQKLRSQCAEILAVKLEHLLSGAVRSQPAFPASNKLLNTCEALLSDPVFREKHKEGNSGSTVSNSKLAVAGELVLKVMRLHADSKPLVPQERVTKEEDQVEVIPWSAWITTQAHDEQDALAKSVLQIGVFLLNAKSPVPRLAMVRKDNKQGLDEGNQGH